MTLNERIYKLIEENDGLLTSEDLALMTGLKQWRVDASTKSMEKLKLIKFALISKGDQKVVQRACISDSSSDLELLRDLGLSFSVSILILRLQKKAAAIGLIVGILFKVFDAFN